MITGFRIIHVYVLFIACQPFATAEQPGIELGRGVPQFLETVAQKKKAHVAFFGGSITQSTKGHTAMIPAWLHQNYPECEFIFSNAGLSSTCSMSGAFRLKDHLLSKGTIDLLIVEFAVNDDQDAGHSREMAMRGLEGVIRHFRKTNPSGDIISVQFVNPSILEKFLKGDIATSVQAHKDVARHYQIPIVDVGMALAAEIKEGKNSWQAYGDTHPSQNGYAFASNLIISVIKSSPTAPETNTWPLVNPLIFNCFEKGKFIDPQEGSWLGGWKFGKPDRELLPTGGIRNDYTIYNALRTEEAGSMMYLTFSGTLLGAFILAGPDAGILEISVDEGEWKKVDLFHHHSKGLHYPRSVMLADGLKDQIHQATIRVSNDKNEASQGTAATILFFETN